MMEKLQIVVKNKSASISALEMKYNYFLKSVKTTLNSYFRQRAIRSELTEAIKKLDSRLKDLAGFLDYLEDANKSDMAKYAAAKINFITYDGSPKDLGTKDTREKFMTHRLREVVDNMIASAQIERDKNQAVRDRFDYINQLKITEQVMEQKAIQLKAEIERLKESAMLLEMNLGYSVGSNLLDMCYNENGDLVVKPQLREIEILEMDEITLKPIIKSTCKQTEKIEENC